MEIFFAPLEGITGYSYRNTHRRFFPETDKYYAPFVAPNYTHHLKGKERADVEPRNNAGMPLVPQILSNHAEDFLWAAGELYSMGYREINLNLGCPMPTVVRKGRGAGQLADPEALDRFLEEICEGMEKAFGLSSPARPFAQEPSPGTGDVSAQERSDMVEREKPAEREKLTEREKLRFSVKTRIGLDSSKDAAELLAVYNRYPLYELTVHPRTQKDLYRNTPDWEVFGMFLEESIHPVVYNGDLCSPADLEKLTDRFPRCRAVMIGRGLIADPALARELKGGSPLQKKELQQFHEALLASAAATLPGASPVLGHMKELWVYMGRNFTGAERYLKEIRKARTLVQYQGAVRALFANADFRGQEYRC